MGIDIEYKKVIFSFILFIFGVNCFTQNVLSSKGNITWNKTGRLKPPMGSYEEFVKFEPEWDNRWVRNFTFEDPLDTVSIKVGFIDANQNGNYFEKGIDMICIINSRDSLFPPFIYCLSACHFRDTVLVRINSSNFMFVFSEIENDKYSVCRNQTAIEKFDVCISRYLDLSIKLSYESDSSTSNAYYPKIAIKDILNRYNKEKFVYFFYWYVKSGPDEIPRLIELSQKDVIIISIFNDISGNISKAHMIEMGMPGFIARPTTRAIYEMDFTECPSGLLMTRDGVIIQRNIQPDEVLSYINK